MNSHTRLTDLVFCSVDLETTGVNPVFNSIIEIGIVRFTLSGEMDVYETLVNPRAGIPPDATAIHGITDSEVESAPFIEDVIGDVTSFIQDSILVIQNPRFDLSFLEKEFCCADISTSSLMAIDTVRLAQSAFPDFDNHKLNYLCSELDIPITPHRALSDARGCMGVFIEVLKKLDPAGTWNLRDLLNYHGDFIGPAIKRGRRKNTRSYKDIQQGKMVRIKYRDSDGNVTVREIIPKDFIKYGKKSYVHAFCLLRGHDRYFQTSRIVDVYR